MGPPRKWSTRDVLPMLVATACVIAAAFCAVPPGEGKPDRESVADRLIAELEGRVGTITRWEIDQRATVERMADDADVREGLSAATEGRYVELDALLGRSCPTLEGCALYRPDGTLLGDFRAREAPHELIRDALRGRTVQSRLLATDALGRLDPPTANPRRGVLFATPIVNDREVKAVLVGRARPDRELGPLLAAHPPGRTGETYVIDPRGFMVTRSRFDVQPRRVAEHVPLVLDRPAIAVRTPTDAPTRAARAAQTDHEGVDVDGYLDYRGVPVVGAWRWLDELGAGVITEMDVAEAFHR